MAVRYTRGQGRSRNRRSRTGSPPGAFLVPVSDLRDVLGRLEVRAVFRAVAGDAGGGVGAAESLLDLVGVVAGGAVARLAADVHQERRRQGADVAVRQAVPDGVTAEALRTGFLPVGDQRLKGAGVARLGPDSERLLVAGCAALGTRVGERLRQSRGVRGRAGGS